MAQRQMLSVGDLPQDPYLPQWTSNTPSFLDSQACLCALRPISNTDKNVAWQCIGNQTQGVYNVKSGKWFKAVHGGTNSNLPVDDNSNPPDKSKPQMNSNGQLVGIQDDKLDVYDRYCTAENQTTFSTAFYRANDEIARNATPISAAACWRPGAIPLQIQSVDDWQKNGCKEGFLCANNTINSLPQFCPPVTTCQEARLSGQVCAINGTNFGMGPFEPVVCRQGFYCPKEDNGKVIKKCPSRHYCQPGASTPTPCSVGSHCPEGASYQLYMVPFVILVLIDLLLLAGVILLSYRRRRKRASQGHIPTKGGGGGGLLPRMTGYRTLPSETDVDREMADINPKPMPRTETWTGFQAVLDPNMPGKMDGRAEALGSELTPQLRTFVDSMRKATDADRFGLSFQYSGLGFNPKGAIRPVLQNVTGSIQRGSLTAIMGGSGAGKSTFVNVLMGKTNHTGGTVMVNNSPGKILDYKKLIGYVPQDDIVLSELTVYENIAHSAKVRLPRTWSEAEIDAHVTSVIDCLELSHVRDSLVGSVGKPVISGGQRKRVSIGMELAAAPMAIFLDEPTSGLDATAASSIMATLKALGRLGITVIVIIHQPRVEIFDMIDDLILLGNGQIVYEGPENDVRMYFEQLGYLFPEHSNSGDVVTDIITGNGRLYKHTGDISKESLIGHWPSYREKMGPSNKHASVISSNDKASLRRMLKTRGAPRFMQLWLCLKRAMLQQYRTKAAFYFESALSILAGGLLGLAQNSRQGVLFIGTYKEPFNVLSIAMDVSSVPELSLLIVIAVGLISGAPGVKTFSEEMLLQRREAEAGHSRVAYFIAKMASVLPRMILNCLHFSVPLFLLSVPVISWSIAFLANLLYFYCIYGLSNIVSMIIRREDAPLISTMISLITGILCGASPPLAKVASWHLEWLWRASPATWFAEIYFGQMVSPFTYLYDTELASTATGYSLDALGRNLGILFLIGTIYRILAYIGLLGGTRLRI